jgi:adenosylcobinamide-phosphate synthase
MHQNLESALIILFGAVLVDVLLGEYPRFLHPVVWLGKIIAGAVWLAPKNGKWRQWSYGTILAFALCGGSATLAWLVLDWSAEVPLLHICLGIFFLKASMALSELGNAARKVWWPLQEGNIAAARLALPSLCSRNPSELSQEEILEATIESLAENVSDSWVAPLFYFLIFGVPGAVGYRVVNTLDAMVGYRGKFEWLGKTSARLDDLLNWIPARLTALLLLTVEWCEKCGKNNDRTGNGWRILRRDADKTPSPNGGHPMAAMAGLLGVQLRKEGAYILGDPDRPVTVEIAQKAMRYVRYTAWYMAFLSAVALALVLDFDST